MATEVLWAGWPFGSQVWARPVLGVLSVQVRQDTHALLLSLRSSQLMEAGRKSKWKQ